jgi:hypothetical protein
MISRSIARIQTRITCQSRKLRVPLVITRHFRVAVEKAFPNAQSINAREEHDRVAIPFNFKVTPIRTGVLTFGPDGKVRSSLGTRKPTADENSTR